LIVEMAGRLPPSLESWRIQADAIVRAIQNLTASHMAIADSFHVLNLGAEADQLIN